MTDEVQAFTPDESRSAPTTLADALRWINTTPERAWALAVNAKWGFSGGSDSPYEYDQGDSLVVDYDSLYDLADIALAVLRLLDPDLPDKGAAVAFLDDLQSNHLREVAESPSDGLGPESGGVS